MNKLEKDRYFVIHEDQWGEHGLVIRSNGMVGIEAIDRKEGTYESFDLSDWSGFVESHAQSQDLIYREVVAYIQENLLDSSDLEEKQQK
jgi:hypothetical protein